MFENLDFLEIIIFILPAYIANSVPVLVGGGLPVDFGKKFMGLRLFGDSKTLQGFIGGVCAGIIASFLLTKFFYIDIFGSERLQFASGCLLSFGTMAGDLAGSFIKRRMGLAPGKPFILDQLFFLVVALIMAYPFSPAKFYQLSTLAFLFIITYFAHIVSNYLANKLGLKKVPW
ncbi:MAG: CDP-2,3-bis-(O-geranylgeranyl)-sn-glycerol synthase [Candidatus Micrarchaeia archaeon]